MSAVLEQPEPVPLTWRVDATAIRTLIALAAGRLLRGRRVLVLGLVYLVPTAIALLARYYADPFRPPTAEENLVFYMIPQALLPLSALVFAAGMVQDEIEDQTLTYLLIRPVPRWLIYATKLLGTMLVSSAVTVVFTVIALAAIHWGEPDLVPTVLPGRAGRIAALFTLATCAYGSIFGCLSLILRRVLVVGVAYVILFEGVFANIDFVVRKATVMWYVRVLAERWLHLHVASWSIDLDAAPTGTTCLLTLLGTIAATTAIAGVLMSRREFRLKTPEGS